MWFLILSLAFGFLLGWRDILPSRFDEEGSRVTSASLVILLFLMGATIGSNREIISQLALLGWNAFCISALSVLGSIASTWAFFRRRSPEGPTGGPQPQDPRANLTWVILGSVLAGMLTGHFLIPGSLVASFDSLSTFFLCVLLAGIGLNLGRNKWVWQGLSKNKAKVILVPLSVALGTLFGSLFAAFLLGIKIGTSLAVGAGFGWYTLSGLILTRLAGAELGALAFLANIMRELLAVVIIAPVARHLGHLAAVAPGGATSMDTTLPIVARATGPETTVISFTSGMVLSMLVPLLVPFFARL